MNPKRPRLSVKLQQLSNVMQAFHTLTQINSTLLDTDYNEILAYPPGVHHSPVCQIIRASYLDRCKACDRIAYQTCSRTGEPHAYCCHAGLYEVVSPIKSDQGIIGYIQFGQVYNQDYTDLLQERMAEYCKVLDSEELQEALAALKPVSSDVIDAAAMLTQTCITYLLNKQIVLVDKSNFQDMLLHYIEDNIRSEITISGLCNYFNISRTSFYELSSQCLDCSVMQYIKRVRLEKAKKLLQDSKLPITQISEQVGFLDYSYFMRVFKKEVGISCKEYRTMPIRNKE